MWLTLPVDGTVPDKAAPIKDESGRFGYSIKLSDIPTEDAGARLCSTCQEREDAEKERERRITADEIDYCVVFVRIEDGTHYFVNGGRSSSDVDPRMQRIKGGPRVAEGKARKLYSLGPEWRWLQSCDWTAREDGAHVPSATNRSAYDPELMDLVTRNQLPCGGTWTNGKQTWDGKHPAPLSEG